MSCSNTIEEDIISQLSQDNSIDYEEQNNIEASFDYNNQYEDEFSDDDVDFDDQDDDCDKQEIDESYDVRSLSQITQIQERRGQQDERKSILKESTNDLRKQLEKIKSQTRKISQTENNQKTNNSLIGKINKPQSQNILPILQNRNVMQSQSVRDQREEGEEIRQLSKEQQNGEYLVNKKTNQDQPLYQPVQNTTSMTQIQDTTSTKNIIQLQNQRNSFVQSNPTQPTSSKSKNIITFEITKNNKLKLEQQINKKKLKPTQNDNTNINTGESFRVLQSPRDTKTLPNIDKIKAKFAKLKQKPPKISSKSWIILNGKNKKLISGQNENQIREIASLTKMMTCLIVVHYIRKLDLIPEKTYFRVSAHAASQPGTSAELNEGELICIMDLLYGMMLPSGNDAAFVLAENFGVYLFMQSDKFKEKYGNKTSNKKLKVKNPITYFIKEMNHFAEKLNMQDTYFTNPHGLMHKKNRSTSYDVALLAYKLIHDPLIRTIIGQQSYKASIMTESLLLKEPATVWKNTNKLLKKSGYIGMKTGITLAAGPCLVSWYKNENVNLIVILLGAKSTDERWSETIQLVEWAKKQLQQKNESISNNNNQQCNTNTNTNTNNN